MQGIICTESIYVRCTKLSLANTASVLVFVCMRFLEQRVVCVVFLADPRRQEDDALSTPRCYSPLFLYAIFVHNLVRAVPFADPRRQKDNVRSIPLCHGPLLLRSALLAGLKLS